MTGIRWITPKAQELLPHIDTVIFDVDGVLLDVSHTIRAVNCLAPVAYLRWLNGWTAPDDLLTSPEIEHFKRAGGFNDDLDLTRALILLYLYKSARYGSRDARYLHPLTPTITEFTADIATRGGWLTAATEILRERANPAEWAAIVEDYNPALIGRFFQEIRGGTLCERLYGYQPMYVSASGNYPDDRVLLDASLMPSNRTLAILTGRTRNEAEVALEMTGLTERIPILSHAMTSDDGSHKPDPDGMRRLVTALDSRVALYVGDARDDLRTVLNYRALPDSANVTVLSAQVLTGTVGEEAPALFADADILADDVNAVLRLL
jgi:phosphoglycolate phosphatase-like HAD superfamily hydrolase